MENKLKPIVLDEEQLKSLDVLVENQLNSDNDPRSINYVRKLNRPKIYWWKVCIAVLIPIIFVLSILLLPEFTHLSKMALYITIISFFVLYFAILGKRIIICLIHIYQRYAPDDIRNKCRFEPSCSEYMILAMEKYGFFRGLTKGIKRLIKCNENNGGYDDP